MSGSEIIFIMLLALVVLGPEKLPEIMRRAGRAYGEFKRMSSSFQDEFRAQIDEPMREMRDTADLIRRNVDVGAAQVEKPKSEAAMSVDMEPDPLPGEPEETAPIEPIEEAAPDTSGADDEAEASPAEFDGFGAVPSYVDHDASGADQQADPEQTR